VQLFLLQSDVQPCALHHCKLNFVRQPKVMTETLVYRETRSVFSPQCFFYSFYTAVISTYS